jgi:hypothetical protein
MQTATHHSSQARKGATAAPFPPLELENRPTVATDQAAYYLNRRQQTMRAWACRSGSGPLTPLRINGRLAWKTEDLRKLLGVAQ